jgi:putative transposase
MIVHVHMCLNIPPKFSVANVLGFIKGKGAISIARNFKGRQQNYAGKEFWARGYFVSTVGLDDGIVRKYICNQGKQDQHREHLKFEI